MDNRMYRYIEAQENCARSIHSAATKIDPIGIDAVMIYRILRQSFLKGFDPELATDEVCRER
jgi:hypothetical protein